MPSARSHSRRYCCYIATLLYIITPFAPAAHAEGAVLPREDVWLTDGEVSNVIPTDGLVYLGGSFSYVGPNTGGGAPVDLDTRIALELAPRMSGAVWDAVPDGTGGWFVAGAFTDVAGSGLGHLVRIRPDGSLDPGWAPNPDGAVHALALSGSTLYLGGFFEAVDGLPRTRVAAVDATTGGVLAWSASVSGVVRALEVSGSTLYIGGQLGAVNGEARSGLGAVDAHTGALLPWDPNANDVIWSLAAADGVVFAGGRFSNIGGQDRWRVAALDPATGAAQDWNPAPNTTHEVRGLLVRGGTLYVGGWYTQIAGEPRNSVAAFDIGTGGLLPGWDHALTGAVLTMDEAGGVLYIGGNFIGFPNLGGVGATTSSAALDATTGEPLPWRPNVGVGDNVYAVSASGSSLYVGGDIVSVGGVDRRGLAALDQETGRPTAWHPDVRHGNVSSMALTDGGTLYISGGFREVAGESRERIAAVDAATGTLRDWAPDVGGTSAAVHTFFLTEDAVYIGGTFNSVGTAIQPYLAAVDRVTGEATPWNPGANGPVTHLLPAGNRVYAAGSFTTIGGAARARLAMLDAATGEADEAWNPAPNQTVLSLALSPSGETLYVGGQFGAIGGQSRNRIAALNAFTGEPTQWNPGIAGLTGALNRVDAITPVNGLVYIGGAFNIAGGQPRGRAAAISAATGEPTPWNPQIESHRVTALAVTPEAVYAGGVFDRVGGEAWPNFAEFPRADQAPPGNPLDVNNDGAVDAVDIQLVINAVLGRDISPYNGDVNGDNEVNAVDIQLVVNAALGLT